MAPVQWMLAALLVPVAGAAGIALCHRSPNLREGVTLATAALLLVCVLSLLPGVLAGAQPALSLIEVIPGLAIAFRLEPLGMLFALIASGLWIVNSLYSIGYMRGNAEHRQTRFYVCFALALCATMGIAFAGNLFTLYLFYELLTLVTYPLVTHHGDQDPGGLRHRRRRDRRQGWVDDTRADPQRTVGSGVGSRRDRHLHLRRVQTEHQDHPGTHRTRRLRLPYHGLEHADVGPRALRGR